MSALDDVFVNEEEMNEKLIAEILKERVTVGKKEGQFYFTDKFEDLNSAQKLATVLVARKASEYKEVIDDQKICPADLSKATGIKKGTVDPALKKLREKNLAKSDNGNYYIPNPNLSKVQGFLESGEENE